MARAAGSTVVGLLIALIGQGCSWFGAVDEPSPARCPPALLLAGADRVVSYAPGQERVGSAIRYIAAIRSLESRCRGDEQKVEVELRFVLAAEAGPALPEEPVRLDLFVATVVGDQLAARRSLDVRLDLGDGRRYVRQLETVTIGVARPGDGRIYLGFELDRATVQDRLQGRRR